MSCRIEARVRSDCEIVDGLRSEYKLWEWSADNSARFINPIYWKGKIEDALDKYPCDNCSLDGSCTLKENVKSMILHDESNLSGVRVGLNKAFEESGFSPIPHHVRTIRVEGIEYQV